MHVIGWALVFWLAVSLALGFIVFTVGSPEGGEDVPGVLLLIALVVGGAYGWHRSRRKASHG